ncbi:hypothetical protein QVD17_07374 [Tagetes erecta]|uniref:VPS9 domain-containing protein n=1 Tax=Tagetes erecta TaxID=13708 RepID=A0AAD8P7D5_TARER|nr:hypothetical protein QVD17_07374 [Tagetes erecta]
MDNLEVSVSTTAARTWHDFWERMRQPSATEFVKQIKSFIVTLSNTAPDPERDAASVQEFFSNMETNFRAHPLWVGRSKEELDSAGEGLEKHVMTKLFTRVFASHPDDVNSDVEFHKKSALIQQFIHPDHLEIRPIYQQNEKSWIQAQKELLKINTYKAPRDKLACILSCCKAISNSMSVSGNENPPGADDFFPVLIYVTLKANPPQFHSNLMYIQRYRNKSRLVGEAAYVFTNMLSAESFILNIDAKALSMSETEFVKNMELAQIVCENLESQSSQSSQSESESKLKELASVSVLENKGATMLVTDEKVSEKFKNFQYLHAEAGDLTVGDVEDLLTGYKQLVFKYVCLAKGMGVGVVQPENQTSGETRDDGGRSDGVGSSTFVSTMTGEENVSS